MRRWVRTEAVSGIRTALHLPSRRPARPIALSDRAHRLEASRGAGLPGPTRDPSSLPEEVRAREVRRLARQEELVLRAQERLLEVRRDLAARIGRNRALQELRRHLVEDRRRRWYGRDRS